MTRVIVAKRSPQNAPRPKVDVRKEGFTDPILPPSYATSASQEQVAAEFSLVEILVLPPLLAIVLRLSVYVAFIVVLTILDLVIGFVALSLFDAHCRAILVFLNFPRATPLELTRRQGRLRARHRNKGILRPNITLASLRPPAAIGTFLYAR